MTPPIVGWDADVWLSYVDGDPSRLPDLDALLLEARNKRLTIITASLSIVEVAFGASERANHALDAATESQIDTLWGSGSPATVVELSPVIARRARGLVRQAMIQGNRLSPRDAIHIATATIAGAAEFHTYDQRLDKFSALSGLNITRPLAAQISLFGSQGSVAQQTTS